MPRNKSPGHTIHVLVVDDEVSQLELTKLNLETLGPNLSIQTISAPSEALRVLKSQHFDCIVTDYQMPVMNGIQFTNEVRKYSDIPIIIYTGRGSEEVASAAFAAGDDDLTEVVHGLMVEGLPLLLNDDPFTLLPYELAPSVDDEPLHGFPASRCASETPHSLRYWQSSGHVLGRPGSFFWATILSFSSRSSIHQLLRSSLIKKRSRSTVMWPRG